MPLPGGGAIFNPQMNPLQSYMQYTHNGADMYNDSYNRGYDWNGTTWTPRAGASQVAPGDPGALGGGSKTAYGTPGLTSGGGGSGGVTSLATGGSVSGPYKDDAQLAQVTSQFGDILKRGLGNLNEQAALSGGFSGGIPYDKRQQYTTDIGMQEASAKERIMNDTMGRNQQSELAKQQFEWQKQLAMIGAGGGGYRTAGAGGAQNSYDAQAQQVQGGGGQQGGMGGAQSSGGAGGGIPPQYAGSDPQSSSNTPPSQAPGESSYAFYKRLDAWHAAKRSYNSDPMKGFVGPR